MRLIYSVLVAGKSARFAETKLIAFMRGSPERVLPFSTIRARLLSGTLGGNLRRARTGRYALLERCLLKLIELDPRACTVKQLEAIPGIGPKTARFFVLWTRPGARHAALDVHVLRWLRAQGHDAPKATPPAGRRYRELEATFLAEADKRGLSARELDSQIWDRATGI